MTLYECDDYKEALKFLVDELKLKRKSVTFEAMAEHCGVQKTYLSKVLNREGNLSEDQFFLASEYLKLNATESHFLENLYRLNTTQVAARKVKFQQAIEKSRKEMLKSENSIKTEGEALHHTLMEKYYLDPYYQLIHIFLTIEAFASDEEEIAKRLGLPTVNFEKYLRDLVTWKVIEFKNGRYRVLKNNLHLPKDSDLTTSFRNFTRFASQNKMNALAADDFYSFSAIISCDDETKRKIQKRFLDFLKQCQNEVVKAESKEVYQINFDLLKWS